MSTPPVREGRSEGGSQAALTRATRVVRPARPSHGAGRRGRPGGMMQEGGGERFGPEGSFALVVDFAPPDPGGAWNAAKERAHNVALFFTKVNPATPTATGASTGGPRPVPV